MGWRMVVLAAIGSLKVELIDSTDTLDLGAVKGCDYEARSTRCQHRSFAIFTSSVLTSNEHHVQIVPERLTTAECGVDAEL